MSDSSSLHDSDLEIIGENDLDFADENESDVEKVVVPEELIRQRPVKIGYGSVDEMPAQHIRLFAPWLFDNAFLDDELYKGVISEADFGLLKDALEEKDDYTMQKNFLGTIRDILYSDREAQEVMKRFLENPARAKEIEHLIYFTHPGCLPEAFFTYWEKLLNHSCPDVIDRICMNMEIGPVLEYLKTSTEFAYRGIYDKLKVYADPETFEDKTEFGQCLINWKARCEILIELITAKPKKRNPEHWYCELLKACNTSPETRAVAFFIDRKFKDVINEYDLVVAQLTKPTPQSSKDFVDPDEAPKEPRPQRYFGPAPAEITREYACSYDLRSYQVELTKKAKDGLNTIICAPTGSGKTHVAAEIISYHLRHLKHSDRVGRVVMFVPTIPLVSQQAAHLSSNLRPEFYVEKLSGAEKSVEKDNIRKAETILRADIIVLTPQIFINMLLSPLRSQKIYIADFTMLVFDECHHCNEQHPYNVLMNMVRESDYKPQIIGLTASVGDGGDSKSRLDADSATEHMLSLCARLNADTVTSIRDADNILEMHHHISKPLDEIIPCRPSERDDFAHEIALISDYIQDQIQDVLLTLVGSIEDFDEKLIRLPLERDTRSKNGSSKATFRYNGKLGMLRHTIDKRDLDRDRRHFLLKCMELLEICYFTLRNNLLMPAKLAFEYFQERINNIERFGGYGNVENDSTSNIAIYIRRLRGMINDIKEKYQYLEVTVPDSNRKPIYDKLLACIEQQYEADRNSRIIIFVESRKGCVKMAEYIRETDALVKTFGSRAVGHIVSVNQSAANFGQSANVQNQILDAFRRGEKNVLFATSVAEEGLDVAKCNLIIKYNSVGSEKSYIQRRGRARAMNSRSILLAISSSVEAQEYSNIMREYLMNICLNNLQTLSEQDLKERIHARKLNLATELKNAREKEAAQRSRNTLYLLECVTCGSTICNSTDVARLMESQFICCAPAAWQNTSIKQRFQKSFTQSVSSLCGEWICVCGTKRGEVIKYGEAYLPLLAPDGFRLRKESSDGRFVLEEDNKFTWAKVTTKFFTVGPITSVQIHSMINALVEYSPEAFADAQMNEEKGILEGIKRLEYEKKEKHALKESGD